MSNKKSLVWDELPVWAVDTVRSIMQSVMEKDAATFEHCLRVGRGASMLAEVAGLRPYEVQIALFAGIFHDIGKTGIPNEILLKPAKLSEEEFTIMKSHPAKSAAMLKQLNAITFFKELVPGILHHHERVDGRGYPYGLKEQEIPLTSKIILVADTFDAMTADRSYRKGLAPEIAYQELTDFSGKQFDPDLVKLFNENSPKWGTSEVHIMNEIRSMVTPEPTTAIPAKKPALKVA